ncbi:hypothetical protein Cni_G04413 [Canna indica]|uniref:Protein cereblon n=1 Tax=Canna indica TaxID=4628 RepID=A0AAQ3JTB9_9LILI|nr:hypothetical protein Cni_G04413 [Canna indica]
MRGIDERILEHERLRMEQIRELDLEELQVEEFSDSTDDDDDDSSAFTRGLAVGGVGATGGFTYNTCLAATHSYLGEVDNTHGRLLFLDGGAILNLPMFYLEGVVLFPEATLPLRVVQPQFVAAVERALTQSDAPYTIGVVRVHWHPDDGKLRFASTGTTAEIRQYRRLDDGSLNIVARGQQRFRLRRRWVDDAGAPCGEVQIVQEDAPLRTPKEAFAQFASIPSSERHDFSHVTSSSISPAKWRGHEDAEDSWDCMSHGSIMSDHSTDMRMSVSASDSNGSPTMYERFDEPSSGDEEFMHCYDGTPKESLAKVLGPLGQSHKYEVHCSLGRSLDSGEKWEKRLSIKKLKGQFHAPMSFLPHWAYQMYDSFSLARRAAELWRKIIGNPSLDDYVRKPELLSFYIASKLPMSEATRQGLLEIDGISYRLQKEIELLKGFNLIRCKRCQTLIAKRSDMLVMSSDGPLNAYVNPHGFVHETITVYNASGLSLRGRPVKEHSWFPGYAWTIADCGTCHANMGWLFTATKRNLLPKSFWGIRSAAVVDDTPR